MAITSRTYLAGGNLTVLAAAVAAAIADDKQPVGEVQFLNEQYVQAVQEGTDIGTFEDLETRVTAAEGDIDDLEAADVVLTDAVAAVVAEVNLLQAAVAAPTALAEDGAIAIANVCYVITKGSAAALTLAAPTGPQAGTVVEVINGTAFEHVITATNLIDDGTTGGSKDTATFAAFVGSSIRLKAYNLKWVVLGAPNNVTIAGS